MEILEINGGKALGGEIKIHGAKNSVLPILAGTVLVNGVSVIHNCPKLSDVDCTVDILKHLGADVKREQDTLIIDTSCIHKWDIPKELMEEMRSSIIFLGSLASRCNCGCMYLPGGCDIGLRPVDLHIRGLRELGYSVFFDGNNLCCDIGNAHAGKVILPFPSVGATENLILASVFLKGKTTIINSAREPEIVNLADFLNSAGADIRGASTPVIEIYGVDSLNSVEHSVIPDRILAGTLMSATAITGGDTLLRDIDNHHLSPIIPAFEEMGCELTQRADTIRIKAPKKIQPVKSIKTQPYPGFPTDCQSPVMSVLTVADGTSVITETIFESRFKHVAQLNRFGADITINDRVAIINGVDKIHSADAVCTDLRGGASVVIEALGANGKSRISRLEHLDRGYEAIEEQLSRLGADIKRIRYEEK